MGAPVTGRLQGLVPCAVTRGPALTGVSGLVYCADVALLNFLVILEEGALHFHFPVDLANYVRGLV